MFLICQVTFCEQKLKGLYEFMGGSPSHLAMFGDHWSSASGNMKYLTCHMSLLNHDPANIRLDEDVLKTSFIVVFRSLGQDQFICLGHMSSRRLPDVFKTFSRRLQDLFKASSRHLQEVLQRYLQDVFKVCHQVNLFYLTRPREVFNTFLSTEEFA